MFAKWVGVLYNKDVHIILTHEQADFDALASLLGAHLLEEQAVPVLPRRVNRNVKAYLTIYGLDLPFVDPRDLPNDPIRRVTLVDTQSLVSLKGMTGKLDVSVVDHHPRREGLPKDWSLQTEETGALTTVMVEGIQARDLRLNATQATLLLLGIYEDTGGLTYTRTTPRDARAAAYLLEHGASLQVARDYLNHPLSHVQQAIYDQLREVMEAHVVHNTTVMVACGDASKTNEEISTVAHKLRDLLDPDALVLLLKTGAGVQMIARATIDQVNVGEITAHFGGGGHPRAAAALIKDRTVEEVHAELIEVLPSYVHPAVTVAEIMSSKPQLVTPETAVREVAEQMQRYGYEGYPVVKDGNKVVGLITRRAVDRTLSHKLNLKVKDVMSAGEAVIHPEDSVERLQQLMTDTGWGQIPVVDTDNGEIIGIVTRTDLIKTLTQDMAVNGRKNLAGRLEAHLSPARLALLKAVAAAAEARRDRLYVVGGFVRDLLLERFSMDYDLVVEGDAIALGEALAARYGGRVATHARFGTAKWKIEKISGELAARLGEEIGQALAADDLPETLDLVTARREFYTAPTVLPTVERGSIKLDLHRRDFTINTLALRLDGYHYGELLDYWGGLADLNNGLVRVLHSLSFVDDPTRILRAVRFEQRFGYRIGERTLELMKQAIPLLDRVSGDRLRHELDTMLKEPNVMQMMSRLSELGVLQALHPKFIFNADMEARLKLALESELEPGWGVEAEVGRYPAGLALAYTFMLMRMARNEAASLAGRVRLPGWLTKIVLAACQMAGWEAELVDGPPSKVAARLEDMPRTALFAHYLLAEDEKARQTLHRYVFEWREVQPLTNGLDLRERGIPPGPVYRQILDKLRAAWLDGEVNSEAQELALLEKLLNE